MKIFKKTLDLWKHYADNGIVSKMPLHLDIELTNRCNLDCQKCPYHGKDTVFPQEPCDMDFELYTKIINEAAIKNVRSVKLSFSGEPLLYPHIGKAIALAKSRGLHTSINTNGTLLDRKMCIILIENGLDVLIITDYNLDVQYYNLYILQAQKQVYSSEKPYIIAKSNDPYKFKTFVDETVPLSFDDYANLIEDTEIRDFKCGYPWQRLLITADGSVLSCGCGMSLIDLEREYLGDSNSCEIEELWNSAKMNFLRVLHEHRETHVIKMCRLCPIRRRAIETL